MARALLIDFGSTYTKVTAVDIEAGEILAQAKAVTTVETDITLGLREAVSDLGEYRDLDDYEHKLACSSAAGGLKMVAVGLVPELTAEAAKRAALGAGARVMKVFAYELTRAEVHEIEDCRPDIILLAGGTDGGNAEAIIHNAGMLASSSLDVPIIIAGNKVVAPTVAEILCGAGKDCRVTENVMPRLRELNVEPARLVIRELFMEKIVEAKGLGKAREIVEGILMPTPAAVLKAARLLAEGTYLENGLGEVLVVDIGGATTDVHSVADGEPTKPGIVAKGLSEPFAKRTVEGDLGVRVSAYSLYESAGPRRIQKNLRNGEVTVDIEAMAREFSRRIDLLPRDEAEYDFEQAMARTAIEIAVERHVGRLETLPTPFGVTHFQYGKDLTDVKFVIGTGGVVVNSRDPQYLLSAAEFDPTDPTILRPVTPEYLVDSRYILAATGLLANIRPNVALRMLKKYLEPL